MSHRILRKNVPPADRSDPPAIFARKEVPPYYAQKNEYPLRERPTCWPTKLTRTEGFVNLVNMNDSSSSYRTMSIQRL